MLDHLLEENKLKKNFEQYGLKEQDIVFIKEMILGRPLCDQEKKERVCLLLLHRALS